MKCLAQEHNTVSLTRAPTQTARSGDRHTNHEVTVPVGVWEIRADMDLPSRSLLGSTV